MATKFNRQDAAISIALMNKTSKLLAAAVKLGKDNLIRDAIDDGTDFKQLSAAIIHYVKSDPDRFLFEQLMHLADTEPIREYLVTHKSGVLPSKVREVADATEKLIEFGNEMFRKGSDGYESLVPFFSNPQAKELLDRAVTAELLQEDYKPAPTTTRFQLKLIAIAINSIMNFPHRDKWCHFNELWGEDVNRCLIPLTKGVAINQVVRLYPEIPLWEKVVPEEKARTIQTELSEAQVRALFSGLMKKGYLPHHTSIQSFLSIFGMGTAPFTTINWIDRGQNSLIYFAKEAFGENNPDLLLKICECFTCKGKEISYNTLKSRSSYVHRNKAKFDFVPVIDKIIARARQK